MDLNEHLIKDATSTRSAEAKALGIGMGVPWLTLHRHRRTRHRRCQGHRPDYRPHKRLNALGIHTIADLRAADPVLIRDRFSVVVQRIVLELRGIPCVQLETERADKKQMIFSRSFAAPVAGTSRMRGAGRLRTAGSHPPGQGRAARRYPLELRRDLRVSGRR